MISTDSLSAPDKLSDGEGSPISANYEKPSLAKSNHEIDSDTERGGVEKETNVHRCAFSSLSPHMSVILGRPDTAARIQEIIDSTEGSASTIVAACGPKGLMLDVRRAVAGVASAETRSVGLHCEQFGW
jgi:hypothetical protein